MDARLLRLAVFVPAFLVLTASSVLATGYSYTTPNFVVNAPSAEFAKQVGETAERYRAQLAHEWLGRELPRWYRPCQVTITQVGQVGAGGATTFTFAGGQVFNWNMRVQGSAERILDSVIPHEVSHTIFASHFRRPLPRWADEGAASLVEHESERHRQLMLLRQVFNTPQRIPLVQLIAMKEYPSDMQSVLTLYAEGYSLADYLVQSGGKDRYLHFLQDAFDRDWNYAIHTYYGLPDVLSLERRWRDWVMAGSPEIPDSRGQMVAQADARGRQPVIRSQSPDAASEPAEQVPPTQVARPFARNDAPVAPSAVDRRAMSVRGEQRKSSAVGVADDSDTAEPIDAAQAAAPQKQGRQRLKSAGWQPAAITASNAAVSNSAASVTDTHSQSNSGERSASESSARRRFRTAKERHTVDPGADASKSQSPFEEAPSPITQRDLADAQTPFHMEN
ncbi:MAG TPA: hypothetical protein VG055_32090 [Planctomycetaceae bacterium]|jgi:hypothetical protein|nr:hypothetical protein [Planctomycetaceae bacterium]